MYMIFYPGSCIQIIQVRSWSINMLHMSSGQCFWSNWGHCYLPTPSLFVLTLVLASLSSYKGQMILVTATIFVTCPLHVHYSRLTPKPKFLYQERATKEQTTNTPKQFGKLYWYSVTVSVQLKKNIGVPGNQVWTGPVVAYN